MSLAPSPALPDYSNRRIANAEWRRSLLISALLIVTIVIIALPTAGTLTGFFLLNQDLAVAVAMVAIFVTAALKNEQLSNWHISFGALRCLLLLGGISLIVGGWFGHYVVMNGYALSRDEQMAVHDAAIFATGEFAIPLDERWHDVAATLNRDFNSTKLRWDLTVSGYRPVNASLHAIMMSVGLLHLTAPVMSAVSVVATWRVAARIWPTNSSLQGLTIIFFLCSAQIWAASMTTYAMSSLLALNMVWLALFLRRDWIGYALSLGVGFFAVGVHQVPYHPMFAAPFLAILVLERRWLLSGLFATLYVAFILFWLRYEDFVSLAMGGGALKIASASISTTLASHVSGQISSDALALTAANLLRLLGWQHLMVLPLAIVAGKAAVRDRNWLVIAMIAACLLPPVLKFVLVPYQGHGWGYRYGHGMLGLMCLLAASGWRDLSQQGIANSRNFAIATALTLVVVVPWQLRNAHRFNAGYAAVDKQLSALKTDFVIVDEFAAPFASDLVNNRADLSNRPIRLLAGPMRPEYIPRICAMGTISLFPPEELSPINDFFNLQSRATPHYALVIDGFKKQCPQNLNRAFRSAARLSP